MKKINSIEEIKNNENSIDCYIMLAGGLARSSKTIRYDKSAERFEIFHEIDGTEETLTENQFKKSLIYQAIEKGALIKY